MPEWIQINAIDASPHDKAAAYVAATMYKFDDFQPYLYKTSRLRQDLDEDRQRHPRRRLHARRARGPGAARACSTPAPRRASTSRSTTARAGSRSSATCPPSRSRTSRSRTATSSSRRRAASFWILDDLTPLRHWNGRRWRRRRVYLFPPRPPCRIQTEKRGRGATARGRRARTCPTASLIDYWLKDKPKKDEIVKIEILSTAKGHPLVLEREEGARGDLEEQAEREGAREGQGQAARAEGGPQPLPLGHADLQADARAEGGLQRGDEGAAQGRARDLPGPPHGRRDRRSRRRSR